MTPAGRSRPPVPFGLRGPEAVGSAGWHAGAETGGNTIGGSVGMTEGSTPLKTSSTLGSFDVVPNLPGPMGEGDFHSRHEPTKSERLTGVGSIERELDEALRHTTIRPLASHGHFGSNMQKGTSSREGPVAVAPSPDSDRAPLHLGAQYFGIANG